MPNDFTHTTLGRTGVKVHRLGLSATYRPGRETIHRAIDSGINYFFAYGFDTHFTKVFRDLPNSVRQNLVVCTGAYNMVWWYPNLRRTLEKRLRQLKTDCLDVFLFLGLTKEKEMTDHIREELIRFREEGKTRFVGVSGHDRNLLGKLARESWLDILMLRYNAAHRGAEQDIFPHLATHDPGVVSYTATRWKYLMKRPKGYPKEGRIPTAGECYRFVLSNDNVDVCLTAPSNIKQLEENILAIHDGPLSDDDYAMICEVGDLVRHKKKLLG